MSTKAMWSLLSTPWSPREADVCSMLPLDRRSERHSWRPLGYRGGLPRSHLVVAPMVAPKSPKAISIQVPVHVALSALAVLSRVYFLKKMHASPKTFQKVAKVR